MSYWNIVVDNLGFVYICKYFLDFISVEGKFLLGISGFCKENIL